MLWVASVLIWQQGASPLSLLPNDQIGIVQTVSPLPDALKALSVPAGQTLHLDPFLKNRKVDLLIGNAPLQDALKGLAIAVDAKWVLKDSRLTLTPDEASQSRREKERAQFETEQTELIENAFEILTSVAKEAPTVRQQRMRAGIAGGLAWQDRWRAEFAQTARLALTRNPLWGLAIRSYQNQLAPNRTSIREGRPHFLFTTSPFESKRFDADAPISSFDWPDVPSHHPRMLSFGRRGSTLFLTAAAASPDSVTYSVHDEFEIPGLSPEPEPAEVRPVPGLGLSPEELSAPVDSRKVTPIRSWKNGAFPMGEHLNAALKSTKVNFVSESFRTNRNSTILQNKMALRDFLSAILAEFGGEFSSSGEVVVYRPECAGWHEEREPAEAEISQIESKKSPVVLADWVNLVSRQNKKQNDHLWRHSFTTDSPARGIADLPPLLALASLPPDAKELALNGQIVYLDTLPPVRQGAIYTALLAALTFEPGDRQNVLVPLLNKSEIRPALRLSPDLIHSVVTTPAEGVSVSTPLSTVKDPGQNVIRQTSFSWLYIGYTVDHSVRFPIQIRNEKSKS